jgi:hypothetical protein
MCFNSSSQTVAANAANQATQQAQAVQQSVAGINSAFANRQAQYSNYLGALNTSYQTQLNQQQASSSRALKFAVARTGMTGGSVAADQGAELQREMGQGTVTADEQAQAKLAGLESSDQASKQQAIALAQSGANVGNSAQQLDTQLQGNIQNAQTNLGPNTLGNIFGGITNTTNAMNAAGQQRLGLRAAQAYTGAFTNNANTTGGYGGSGAVGGP